MPEVAKPAKPKITEFSLTDLADLCAGMSRLLVGLSSAPPFNTGSVGLSEWVALSMLSRDEGIGNKQLAKKLGVTGQRANQITTALSSANMISVGVSPSDSRKSEIRITAAGKSELQSIDSELKKLLTVGLGGNKRAPTAANKQIRRLMRIVHPKAAERESRKAKALE